MLSREILTASEEETAGAGEQLGASLRPGDVVLLTGQLRRQDRVRARSRSRVGASPDDVSARRSR